MAFSGFQDFNPDFAGRLQDFFAASPGGISINSGYRSNERQAELFAQKLAEMGGNVAAARRMVAPPIGLYGSKGSRHTHRIAADLGFATPEDRAWAHANAEKYGLNFRMGHEPWHIELAGEGGQTLVAQNDRTGATVPVSGSQAMLAPPEQTGYQSRRGEFEPAEFKSDYSIKGVGELLDLANLISPKRSVESQELLKKIRNYA